ncbi:MAG: esterase family protein [Chloroflexi bacterium]|nr:MAG: esterase family protein [Chloroflexota bacterium]
MRTRHHLPKLLFLLLLALIACEPLALNPTAQVIIVSPQATATPLPTATRPATRTPFPTNTPTEAPSPTPPLCPSDSGEVIRVNDFVSEVARGENLRYRVYLPPCYVESQARYPVTILLHGAGSTEAHWDDLGVDEAMDQGLRLNALAPTIIVMPFMGSIGNRNVFPPDPSYEQVILDELLPAIERDFCTWNDRDHRAIGGISRGGFWAYSIGLRHPDVFGAIGGHSAFFDPDNAPPANNPLDLALNSSFLDVAELRLYLDNAAAEFVGPNQELFSSRLSSRGIPHTYVINPIGDHNDQYWSSHISEYLTFYTREWPKNVSELPSCLEPSP